MTRTLLRGLRYTIGALVLLFATPAAAQKIIVIDPGHGGRDPGGTGNNMEEKNIVLDVCQRFRDLLNADTADTAGGGKWTVHITRDTDVFVGLSARASYANSKDADRFMSIHSNAFGDPSANGTETFSFSNGTTGAALRNLVQEEMIAAWGLRNRGNKTANFAVLRETAMPAVLHELGFITNTGDAAKLRSEADRQLAAEAHLRAIQRHFNITPYIPGSAPPPTEGNIAGTVSGDEGAIAGAAITLDGEAAATTADDGTFEITDVAEGEHVLGASAAGYRTADQTVTVVAGETAQVDLTLAAEDTNPLPPDGGNPPLPGTDAGMTGTSAQDSAVSGGCQMAPGRTASPLALFLLVAFTLPLVFRHRRSKSHPAR